jgi:hypothetical protein
LRTKESTVSIFVQPANHQQVLNFHINSIPHPLKEKMLLVIPAQNCRDKSLST